MSATVKVTITIREVPADTEVDAVAWVEQLLTDFDDVDVTIESIEADVDVPAGTVRRGVEVRDGD